MTTNQSLSGFVLYLEHQNLSGPGTFTLKHNLKWFPTGSAPVNQSEAIPMPLWRKMFILYLEKHQK